MFKVLKIAMVSWTLGINCFAMDRAEPEKQETNFSSQHVHDLIYKLLTLKAQYLGEDLHQEIEKIKDDVYANVTEQDIRSFAAFYNEEANERANPYLNDEQRAFPERLRCGICFDGEEDPDKKIDPRTLLIGEAYFPKEYKYPPCFGCPVGKIGYVQNQLLHAYHYRDMRSLPALSQSMILMRGEYRYPELEEIDNQLYQIYSTGNYEHYREIICRIPLKRVIWKKEYLDFDSEDALASYLEKIKKRINKDAPS